ncbi:methyl-accepting chemotaxis protein [Anaeromicropila herbilytica]|uniref:Chemotaxis protein n=1 Tax=Anaeromicropila herbilytica TaxID=2785025 RepID=A0A7R7EJM4_9FIRM|nr:methyl-accepting chemotaxis protein [Anaeromicropila herbilytica]BCN29997.1 chemotaxis protein [Anaeromicropila herbilytica]
MTQQYDLEILKLYARTQINTSLEEVMFAEISEKKVVWKLSSDHFNLTDNEWDFYMNKSEIVKAMEGSTPEEFRYPMEENQKKIIISILPIKSTIEHSTCVFITVRIISHPMVVAFNDYAPIIASLFKEGSLITLTNRDIVLDVNRSDKYDVSIVKHGLSLEGFDIINNAMSEKKALHAEDISMVYGPPTKVQAAPYFDRNTHEVVGALNIIRPKQTEYDLINLSENLETQLNEVTNIIQEVAKSSETIHTNEQSLFNSIEEITNLADQINAISDLIRSVADSTKMLGLNASIEAARAGNFGKGFSVVANEINKLSEKSKNTVPIIKKLIDDIKSKVEESKEKSHISVATTQEQVAATEEITASLEEISRASVELAKMATEI